MRGGSGVEGVFGGEGGGVEAARSGGEPGFEGRGEEREVGELGGVGPEELEVVFGGCYGGGGGGVGVVSRPGGVVRVEDEGVLVSGFGCARSGWLGEELF